MGRPVVQGLARLRCPLPQGSGFYPAKIVPTVRRLSENIWIAEILFILLLFVVRWLAS
jgi:hypothetical protein